MKKFLSLLTAALVIAGLVGCQADTDTWQADTEQTVQGTQQTTETTAGQPEQIIKEPEKSETENIYNEIDIYAESDSEYVGIKYDEFSDKYFAIEIESDRFSLSDLSYSENLKRLTINKLGADNLNGIENFPNLEYLTINDDCVRDISDLSKLKNLDTIWIRFTSTVEDYSVLSELENLKEFGAILCNDGGTMPHIEAIENCLKLEKLYLQGFTIEDIGFIENLKNLKDLRLWSYKTSINDIEALTSLSCLEKLDITHDYTADEAYIFENLTALKELSVITNYTSDENKTIKEELDEIIPDCEINIVN